MVYINIIKVQLPEIIFRKQSLERIPKSDCGI